jgi:hypothetical protein
MTDSKTQKLDDKHACLTCRHSSFGEYGRTCRRFVTWNPLTGWEQKEMSALRDPGGECGLSGKGWEARVSPPWIVANFGVIVIALMLAAWWARDYLR